MLHQRNRRIQSGNGFLIYLTKKHKICFRVLSDLRIQSRISLKKCTLIILQANDSYLQMAIGNAPWPIGVTMVGIHARTGREKIFAQNVARILFEIHWSDMTLIFKVSMYWWLKNSVWTPCMASHSTDKQPKQIIGTLTMLSVVLKAVKIE